MGTIYEAAISGRIQKRDLFCCGTRSIDHLPSQDGPLPAVFLEVPQNVAVLKGLRVSRECWSPEVAPLFLISNTLTLTLAF